MDTHLLPSCGHRSSLHLQRQGETSFLPTLSSRHSFSSSSRVLATYHLLYAFIEPLVMPSFLFWFMYPSSILAWRIPRTEEPGRGLQSGGLQRAGHDRACTRGISKNPSLQPDDSLHSFLHRPGPGQLHVHWNSTCSQTAWLPH